MIYLNYLNKIPLITIAITCFNASLTIERALLSALNQDWSNFEILIVDDASTDNSYEIIRKFAKRSDKIRIIQNSKNKGCAFSRNILIENAKGEFIAFFDDDDVSLKERLSLQYKKIFNHEKIYKTKLIACYASGFRIYPNGYKKIFNAVGSIGNPIVGHKMADFLLFGKKNKLLLNGSGTPTCSFMSRKEIFKIVGKFDQNLSRQEDVDFAIRLGFLNGHFIGIRQKVIYQYFTNGIEKTPEMEFKNTNYILKKNINYLTEKKIYDYILKWTKLRYLHFSKNRKKEFFTFLELIFKYPQKTFLHIINSGFRRIWHELRMRKTC